MTKKSRQIFKYLENEKSVWGEIKSISHHFERTFNWQKLSKTWECAFQLKFRKYLFLRLKIWSAKGAYLHTVLALCNWYSSSYVYFWCYWKKWECWMNLRFLVLIRGMMEGGELKISLCYPRGLWISNQYFVSKVAYLVSVDCLYLIKPMVVGLCWRFNWTVGSSGINVLTDLILFRYQTAIKYTINFSYQLNILRHSYGTTL